MKNAVVSGASGVLAATASITLTIAEAANDYQAFFGIVFGGLTLCVFIWATIKNQARQSAKFEKWRKQNGNDDD